MLPRLIPLTPNLFIFMTSKNILIRGLRSSVFIHSPILQNNFSKMGTIKDINLPNIATRAHALNSLNIYKGTLNIHPPFQTSSSQAQIVRQKECCPSLLVDQHMDAPQSLTARQQTARPPNSNHLCFCSNRKSHISPKSTNIHLDPCQLSGCWQDGWFCACPVCTRTASDLHVEDSLMLHLKLPEKIN